MGWQRVARPNQNMKLENGGNSMDAKYARLEARVDALADAVRSNTAAVAAVEKSLGEVQKPRPTNWIAIIGLFIAFASTFLVATSMVASAGWVWLKVTMQPLEVKVLTLESKVEDVRKEASREMTWQFNDFRKREETMRQNLDRVFQKTFGLPPEPIK